MIGLSFRKVHKAMICVAAVMITVFVCTMCFVGQIAYAAELPSLSVQIGTSQSDVVTLESGSQGTALVFLDCSEHIFKSGDVTLSFDASVFSNVSVKSDVDTTSDVNVENDVISVKFSFESSDGFKGILQLGTVSFTLNTFESSLVNTEIRFTNIQFVGIGGTDYSGEFDVKNISITVKGKNVIQSATPSSTAGIQTPAPTASPGASETTVSTPKPTNKTEILADTDMYTLEDVEDLSNGAIVFWGLVFMVVGVWIGLALGYWIWCKRKSKPQVKDTHSNVIGHLK